MANPAAADVLHRKREYDDFFHPDITPAEMKKMVLRNRINYIVPNPYFFGKKNNLIPLEVVSLEDMRAYSNQWIPEKPFLVEKTADLNFEKVYEKDGFIVFRTIISS